MKEIQLKKAVTVSVYSKGCTTDACSVIRLLYPISSLNWNIIWNTRKNCLKKNFDINPTKNADLIIIQRDFPSKKTAELLLYLLNIGIPVVYDLDDLLLDNQPEHPRIFYFKTVSPYIKWLIKEADLTTVSTAPLKNELTPYTDRPIHVIKNLVNYNLFLSKASPHHDKFNILVSGTATHQEDWAIIKEPVFEILKKYKDRVNVVFFGDAPKAFRNHPSVRSIDFKPNYKDYASCLKELDIHIALVPLKDTKFNQCKSNIKWLEYSAAGILGIYSDITPYCSCINNGLNGILVENNPKSWFLAIENILLGKIKTTTMIEHAQEEVFYKYSIDNSIDIYSHPFQTILNIAPPLKRSPSPPPARAFLTIYYNLIDKVLILYKIFSKIKN
ncbi:glycosyltransferase family 1 protein [Methylomonas sp. MO1]|uniref:glycosyltransferase family 1 protein n=1 Tax=unclassified Methylomonas TaxID=2608980 RepID=UPI00047D5B3C|nr:MULTISPECIES: glycosyltransferase family 1 protein [unclassified Methylomonas]MDT4291370.1 glycosyltransferase family 1 protein [Methylomonas sp. MO1]